MFGQLSCHLLLISASFAASSAIAGIEFLDDSDNLTMVHLLNAAHWANLTEENKYRLLWKSPSEVLDELTFRYVQFVQGLEEQDPEVEDEPDGEDESTDDEEEPDDGEELGDEDEPDDENCTRQNGNLMQCKRALQQISFEDCAKSPGTITDLYRSETLPLMKESGTHAAFLGAAEYGKKPSRFPVWPINMSYPGLQTLDVRRGIHVVEQFLTAEECSALIPAYTPDEYELPWKIDHDDKDDNGCFEVQHSWKLRPSWRRKFNDNAPLRDHAQKLQTDIGMRKSGSEQQDVAGSFCTPADVVAKLRLQGPKFLDKCIKDGFGTERFHSAICPSNMSAVRNLDIKIDNLTGSKRKHREAVRTLHYERGEFYADHADSQNLLNGAELMTLIIYLNDADGGATYFPKLDIRVEARRGRALIFRPLMLSGEATPSTAHSSEEVKSGTKWALTTWLSLDPVDKSNPCGMCYL